VEDEQASTDDAEGEEPAAENGADDDDALAEVGEWSITIEVVGEKTLEFTNSDAEKLGPKEIVAAEKDKDEIGEEQVWTGILLEDLLDFAGVTEFSVISVVSEDGSTREFDPERISEGATGIGWMVNGEPLDADADRYSSSQISGDRSGGLNRSSRSRS
jgi:hypothetical protein